jgi:hypothetical protein
MSGFLNVLYWILASIWTAINIAKECAACLKCRRSKESKEKGPSTACQQSDEPDSLP